MAYIPTIKTFEDDINENRRFDEPPILGGVEKIGYEVNPLVPEKKEKSLTKKVLTFIAVLFIAASLALLGYYFYNQYLEKQKEAQLIAEATQRQEEAMAGQNLQNELSKILPKLAPGISPYVQSAVQKNNIIILTIKNNDMGIDNYSAMYAYIMAHEKDLNSDLFYAFKIEEKRPLIEMGESFSGMKNPYSYTEEGATSSETASQIPSYNNPYTAPTPSILGPYAMSSADLIWERKTLYNQDFETANAGVTTLFYGYVNKKYLIITTYLNEFFDTIRSLQ